MRTAKIGPDLRLHQRPKQAGLFEIYFLLIKIQGKIKSLRKKRKLTPWQKNVVKATLCFLHRKTLGSGKLALNHGSILTQLTWMKLIQRMNLNLNGGG